MGATSIEWTDSSINPIRARNRETGAIGHFCEMISPGCAHCYAHEWNLRVRPNGGKLIGTGLGYLPTNRKHVELILDETKLQEILRRRKPTKYFWCDMTDLFGEWVPDAWLDRIFATMYEAQWHTHQVLTKRPERMLRYFSDEERLAGVAHAAWDALKSRDPEKAKVLHWTDICFDLASSWPLKNVWLGVSVEDEPRLDRLELLLQTPAWVRFVSAEPLLSGVDFGLRNWASLGRDDCRLDWMIVGGESGRHARPCNLNWIRFIVDDCRLGRVPCFVKQLGSKPFEHSEGTAADLLYPDGVPDGLSVQGGWVNHIEHQLHHHKGGDPGEWPEDLCVRQFPRVEVAA